MTKFLFTLILAFIALPAMAEDLVAQKNDIQQNSKQETVALGNNRFLLFSGNKSAFQYVWGIELIKVEGGVPKLQPLFMEEYDLDNKTLAISEGVGFPAMSYHFDPLTGQLDYISRDIEADIHFFYKYKLVGDTLKLIQIATQDISQCAEPTCKGAIPNVIFIAEGSDAKAH